MSGSAAADPIPTLVMVGTKAQFIKTAPILRELDSRRLPYRLVYTGQHSETFQELEAVFGTRPADDNLVPGLEADTAGSLLGWMARFCLAAFVRIRGGAWRGAPIGLVHGDTASTLLGAIALKVAGVPVAHVEAGLRSPRLLSPFPEEIIRRMVSRLSDVHLAPDATARANLHGVRGEVRDTGGNTLRDALLMALDTLPARHVGGTGGYAVASLHRSENLSHRPTLDLLMEEVIAASRILPVRFVLHPVTRTRLMRTGWMQRLQAEPGINLLARTDYVSFVALMVDASLLMTDGGSNQEEAAMLGLPTVLMRAATERPDGIAEGRVLLSGLDRTVIRGFVERHAGAPWPLLDVEKSSPSARIVDVLAGAAE